MTNNKTQLQTSCKRNRTEVATKQRCRLDAFASAGVVQLTVREVTGGVSCSENGNVGLILSPIPNIAQQFKTAGGV